MSAWHRLEESPGELTVTFEPNTPHRFWPVEVLRLVPLSVGNANSRRIVLTGPGAVWMYAHAGAAFRKAGAAEVAVRSKGSFEGFEDRLDGCESQLAVVDNGPEKFALLTVSLRASPGLGPAGINRLLEPRLDELARVRPSWLVLRGRAGVDVYTRAAVAAIDCGARRIDCWSARDGLVVVHDAGGTRLGAMDAVPGWLARVMPEPARPVVIGVIGDPCRGKSVFSGALDAAREGLGLDGWKLDCDAQSPTPNWYLSMSGDESARLAREEQKRPWTPDMEEEIAKQIRMARRWFSALVADLPGGNHKASPPMRIPPGREVIFREVDTFVLLDSPGLPSEGHWREALSRHGLEGRLAAVLVSRDPKGDPALAWERRNGIIRGDVSGLDRSRRPGELRSAYGERLDGLWGAITSGSGAPPIRRTGAMER